MIVRRSALILGCLLATGSHCAAAPLQALDRFRISAGTFSNTLNLDGRVDGGVEFDGSTRDFDQELDFAHRRSLELFELGWRPFERHEFNLRHYRDSRVRTARLDTELRFAGEVFPIQAEASGRAAFQTIDAHYTGWLHATRESAFGVQLGVIRLSASLAISGEIRNPEFGSARGEAAVSDHVHAPLIGFSARRVVGTRTRLFGEARAFRLNHHGIDGRAFSASAGIEFYPVERVGLVVQYSDSWIEAERRSAQFTGRLEVGFRGPQAMLRLRW